jgi:radical SAM protein with 4Fe4S-binding SPASM domain
MELDEKYSPSRIDYSLPHRTSDYKDEDIAEQFRDVLIELYKNRRKIRADIPQISWRLNPLEEGKVKRFSCGLHTTQTTILPDKSFVRCSKIDNKNDSLKEFATNELLDKNSPIELAKNKNSECSKCIALACCGGGCPFDGMKRFNCLTDKRECVITPALINNAINDILKALKNGKVKLKDGLIEPEIIYKILWS